MSEVNTEDAADLYRRGRELMEKGQVENAVALFEQSVSLDPHFKTLELLGECLMRSQRFREAIVPLAAATTLNKGVRAASLLAETFLKLNEHDAAKEMAQVALNRDANNRTALNVLKSL